MMLGEESEPARIWESIGNECLRRGVKRIVMMVRGTNLTRKSQKLIRVRVLTGTLLTIQYE